MKSLATVQLPVARFLGEIMSRRDDALVAWVTSFAKALAYYSPTENAFAAELIADVEKFRSKDAARKRLPDKKLPPPGLPELYAYVAANDLDEAYSREWYDMCVARGWKDRDGNPIVKWKGALTNYVKARVANAIAAAVKEAK